MELSFAARAKAELCRVKTTKKCCAAAECYGALLYCNSFTSREIRVITGSAEFAERLPRLFRRAFGFGFDVLPAPDTRPGARRTLLIEDRGKLAGVFRAVGMEPDDTLALHINLGVLENDCCRAAFVRGAFLAGGSITDPGKGYHLQLATSHMSVSRELYSVLLELGFSPREARRGRSFVTYFKQSEAIADFLTCIGAPVAAMELMAAKVEKDMRNVINRKVNCDTANADKTVAAAQEQLAAIRRIEVGTGLRSLPEKLQQAAQLRAQGEFEKADDLLEIAQTYLLKLLDMEQWAAEYQLDAAKFQASIYQWQQEFQLSAAKALASK